MLNALKKKLVILLVLRRTR